MSILRENLIKRMREVGLNMKSLSEKSGTEGTAIKHLIGGQTINPRIDTVNKWANALNCSIDELCGNIPPQRTITTSNTINRECFITSIETVDRLLLENKNNNNDLKMRALLYIAAYEFNMQGMIIDTQQKLSLLRKFIQNQ